MKKLIRALLPLTLAAASVSGCSTQLARPIGLATNLPPAEEIDEARVIVEKRTCPKSGPNPGHYTSFDGGAGLGAAILGTAVDFGINFIGEWLETQQVRRNAVWSASGTVTLCSAALVTEAGDERQVSVRRAVIDSQGDVKYAPAFDLKGKLIFTQHGADTLQMRWKADAFAYGRTAAPARGSKRKHVVVLLGFAPSAVLKTGEAPTGKEELPGVIRLDLGYVQDGHLYPEAVLQQLEAVSTVTLPANDTLNVTAVVVETEDESLALKALSAAFESNKEALAGSLKGDDGQ